MTRRAALGLAAVAVLAAGLAAMAGLLPAGDRAGPYLLAHAFLGAVMLVAWRLPWPLGTTRVWLTAGLLARLLLVPATSYTTHDVERYLWDGRVLLEGIDPYRVAPADPVVAHLRQRWSTPEENEQYATLYPPAALGLFALCAAFGPTLGPWLYRLAASIASMLLLLVVANWLRDRDRSRALPLVALNPLLILEAGIGAHVDIFAALALVLGLREFERLRAGWAGAWLALGASFKALPWLALFPMVLVGRRTPRIRVVATAMLTGLAIYGLALAGGLRPLGSLPAFLAGWRFGSPVVSALEAVVGDSSVTGLAILLFAVIGAVAIGLAVMRCGDLLWAVAAMLALAGALSPVLFPWYLMPLAALLAVVPSRFVIAWTLTLPLTYEVIDRFDVTGAWSPAAWPLWVVAGACLAGLWLDRRRASGSCGRSRASS